jgi:hypothetical protein
MSGNGNGGEFHVVTSDDYKKRAKEAADTVARLAAERDRLDAAIEDGQRYREEVEQSAERAGVRELVQLEGLRRSKLDALTKSRLIRQLGKAGYDQIPW